MNGIDMTCTGYARVGKRWFWLVGEHGFFTGHVVKVYHQGFAATREEAMTMCGEHNGGRIGGFSGSAIYEYRRRLRNPPPPPEWAEVLGVTWPFCTRDDVKDAYRKLAKIHHPDRGGNARKFTRIEAAYRDGLRVVGA